MGFYLTDKHYQGEPSVRPLFNAKNISVRLTPEELAILKTLYPSENISFAIRSLIHASVQNKKM